MKKLRSRLNILLYLLVCGTSVFSLVLSAVTRNRRLMQQASDAGLFAAKDVLLCLVAIIAIILLVTFTNRSTTNPIRELSRATREVASGNFDVTVELNDRIEEFGELENNFNLMTAELRSNEYLRKDFISNVSHQLKTPLSILQGYAELLEEGSLSEAEQKEYAAFIAKESARLSALVNDMLRLSRMDHQEIATVRKSFDLSEDVRRAVIEQQSRLDAAGIELSADIQELSFTGDPELLHQVWTNLLDNAIKFTPAGGKISLQLRQEDDKVLFRVADSGSGLDEEALQRIFEPFYRGNTGRESEGTGLGLPLVKRICELHGGSITAENRNGAVFTAAFPVKVTFGSQSDATVFPGNLVSSEDTSYD